MKSLIIAILLVTPQLAFAGDGRDRALPDQYECPGCGGWAKYRADQAAAQQATQQHENDRLERLQQREQELLERQEELNRRLERDNRRLEELNRRGRDYDRGYGRDSYRDYDSGY